MPEPILYQYEFCPYCMRVRDRLAEKKISYKKVNVSTDLNDPIRKKLLKESGVNTVPVLQIGDKYIGGSQKIIDYLEESY
ncbi:MAG: glutathione S-transferase N-terminal domain-containing protein [Nanoarchaeota archaeon]